VFLYGCDIIMYVCRKFSCKLLLLTLLLHTSAKRLFSPFAARLTPLKEHSLKRIPNVVHFVISDKGTRYFDWTNHLAVRAACERLKPSLVNLHILDGIEPVGPWWRETLKLRPSVVIVPFTMNDIGEAARMEECCGLSLTKAHVADFYRMEVLIRDGGIYFDMDHVALQDYSHLLDNSMVWGRQARTEHGNAVAVGCIMAERNNSAMHEILHRMRAAYTGEWSKHSIDTVHRFFTEHGLPEKNEQVVLPKLRALILPYPVLFPFEWNPKQLQELFFGVRFDWTKCLSVHLFHSKSEGIITRWMNEVLVKVGAGGMLVSSTSSTVSDNNFLVALRRSITNFDTAFLPVLQRYPLITNGTQAQLDANIKKHICGGMCVARICPCKD
jgi:hypothetical protein